MPFISIMHLTKSNATDSFKECPERSFLIIFFKKPEPKFLSK